MSVMRLLKLNALMASLKGFNGMLVRKLLAPWKISSPEVVMRKYEIKKKRMGSEYNSIDMILFRLFFVMIFFSKN